MNAKNVIRVTVIIGCISQSSCKTDSSHIVKFLPPEMRIGKSSPIEQPSGEFYMHSKSKTYKTGDLLNWYKINGFIINENNYSYNGYNGKGVRFRVSRKAISLELDVWYMQNI